MIAHAAKIDEPFTSGSQRSAAPSGAGDDTRSRWRTVRDTAGAVAGTVLGIAPHLLHHIGLLAGAALVTGASGNALFYVIGLVFSVPMLHRLYRRFRTPWAPAIAVVVFTGLFSLSAFVIGPAISGTDDPPTPSGPTEPTPSLTGDHRTHHANI
jgi:hypothetical protein